MVEQNDELSLGDIIKKLNLFFDYLRTKLIILFIFLILGIILGWSYYYTQIPKYEAECTFVLDDKSGSGGGGLASLASSFGVDIGSIMGGGGNLFAYDNLLDILQSRRIIESVLLSEVDTAKNTHVLLADLYLNMYKNKKNQINFKGCKNREGLSLLQDSILFVIYKNFVKTNLVTDRTNKKTQIFKVVVTSPSERFSMLMSERIVAETKNLYVSIKTSTTQKNIDRLQLKADSLLNLLNGKSYESAEVQVLNANNAFKSVSVPSKLASRNEAIFATLYTEVVKNLETAKTTLMMQTPVIQILDKPTYPLEKIRNGRLYSIIISSLLMNVIIFFFYLIKYYKSKM